MPQGDAYDMPSSKLRFADGAAFRTECPTVNTAEAVRALLERADRNDVVINRITETYSMFRAEFGRPTDLLTHKCLPTISKPWAIS